jgi:hypothetical protein
VKVAVGEKTMSEKPTSLDFLQAVYLNETLPLGTRLRAAIEAAPYEHSKQPARVRVEQDFGHQLDRAIDASNRAKLIDGRVIDERGDGE